MLFGLKRGVEDVIQLDGGVTRCYSGRSAVQRCYLGKWGSGGAQLCCLAELGQVEVLFEWVRWLEMLFCGDVFWESGSWWEWVGLVARFSNTPTICDAMSDLVRLAQIKKHEKHPWTILL